MSDNRILPTHRCFDDALELLEQLVREDAAIATNNTVLLVHGVIRGTEETGDVGCLAHAWLEERRGDGTYLVWDGRHPRRAADLLQRGDQRVLPSRARRT